MLLGSIVVALRRLISSFSIPDGTLARVPVRVRRDRHRR